MNVIILCERWLIHLLKPQKYDAVVVDFTNDDDYYYDDDNDDIDSNQLTKGCNLTLVAFGLSFFVVVVVDILLLIVKRRLTWKYSMMFAVWFLCTDDANQTTFYYY